MPFSSFSEGDHLYIRSNNFSCWCASILKSYFLNYKIIAAISLGLILLFSPHTPSYGERLLEQYGNKVTVSAEMTRIKINYKGGFADFNDPLGIGTGEVAVLSSYNEPGHQTILETELHLSDWDLQWHDAVPHGSPTPGKNKINKAFADQTKYNHVQCRPMGTLKAVFVVYNVNGNWPNWSNLLGDLLASAGVTTIKELAIQAGYLGAETLTTGGLVAAIAVSVALKQLLYHIRGNESLGTATREIDLESELGDNGEQTYTVTTEETQYGSAEITFVVRTNTEEVPCSEVSSTAMALHSGDEQYALLDDALYTPDGVLMANAIQTTSISITNTGDNPISSIYLHFDDGSIRWVGAQGWDRLRINDNTVLLSSDTPLEANKAVNVLFKWDGTGQNVLTSNPTIVLGPDDIGISDFPDHSISISNDYRIKIVDTAPQIELSDDAITHGATILLAHQTAMEWLLEIQNHNAKLYDNLADQAWDVYDKTKDDKAMQQALNFEQESRQASADAKTTVQLLNSARDKTRSFYGVVNQNGFDSSQLQLESETKLADVIDVSKINTWDDLVAAINNAKDALRVMHGEYQDLAFGIDTVYHDTILMKPMQEFWQSACADPSQLASLPNADLIGINSNDFAQRCLAYDAIFAGPPEILGFEYETTQPPTEPTELIVSATPQSVSGSHKIGTPPTGSPCPTPLGSITLNSNKQGTWSVQSKPSWMDVNLAGNQATIAFNCNIEPVPQTLNGNIVYSFSNSDGIATVGVPVTVQVT